MNFFFDENGFDELVLHHGATAPEMSTVANERRRTGLVWNENGKSAECASLLRKGSLGTSLQPRLATGTQDSLWAC